MVNTRFFSRELLQYKLRQLGWQGWLGLSLLLVSLLLMVMVVRPQASKIETLTSHILELKTNPNINKLKVKTDTQFDIEQKFYALLPQKNEANNKITEILHAATSAGIVTNKVEYSSQSLSATLIKYQISLPVQGSYVQIRQFINAVLNNLPTVALNDISMKRENIGSDLIEANIKFTIYLRKRHE
ncbi:hypothetical protein C3Y98_05880 [Methylotenera oryzisoli]|uniref:Transmembrane protein n=1 Tax=Methylotenera oryzisoli TaxID=2080758 RepID=A0A4Y9VT19_9PROT|nr:type 4a pilus biogenesis protein PilO [Methylotenera oryzisoli]TFW71619.1 hypothetical protein C3Y98_05880 [Methylotenera oryzisoli]